MKGHRKLEKVQEKDMNFSTVPWYLQTEHFFPGHPQNTDSYISQNKRSKNKT